MAGTSVGACHPYVLFHFAKIRHSQFLSEWKYHTDHEFSRRTHSFYFELSRDSLRTDSLAFSTVVIRRKEW